MHFALSLQYITMCNSLVAGRTLLDNIPLNFDIHNPDFVHHLAVNYPCPC